MPYIPLKENLPGITGLLDYRLDTALPIRQLTQILLRGESTLTEGERELIAAVTSYGNECRFCTAAHTAASDLYFGDPAIAEAAKKDRLL
jgi:AhpD family alkylhydroperoxidase